MGEFSGFALVPEQGAIPQKGQLDPDMQRRIEAMAALLVKSINCLDKPDTARPKQIVIFDSPSLETMRAGVYKP